MAKKMTGIVAQFGTKGYGFITGDDGEKYFVHQKNVYNKSRLRTDTRVKYRVETSEKGLVAVDVKLEKLSDKSKPLTDNDIKFMLCALFVFQLVVAYFIFFKYQELKSFEDIENGSKLARAGIDYIENAAYCLQKVRE